MSSVNTQQQMKNARISGKYDGIWQNTGKCVFCDLKDKYIIYEENKIVLTVNLFAYIDGHLLIVPRRHVRSPKQLSAKEWETVRKLSYIAKKIIRKAHGYKGMWTLIKEGAVAQGSVEHLHIQCLPFDKPDLCQWNYRRLQNTPLENAQIYKKNIKKIKELGEKFEKKYKK